MLEFHRNERARIAMNVHASYAPVSLAPGFLYALIQPKKTLKKHSPVKQTPLS